MNPLVELPPRPPPSAVKPLTRRPTAEEMDYEIAAMEAAATRARAAKASAKSDEPAGKSATSTGTYTPPVEEISPPSSPTPASSEVEVFSSSGSSAEATPVRPDDPVTSTSSSASAMPASSSAAAPGSGGPTADAALARLAPTVICRPSDVYQTDPVCLYDDFTAQSGPPGSVPAPLVPTADLCDLLTGLSRVTVPRQVAKQSGGFSTKRRHPCGYVNRRGVACGRDFYQYPDLITHFSRCHLGMSFYCEKTKQTFTSWTLFLRHAQAEDSDCSHDVPENLLGTQSRRRSSDSDAPVPKRVRRGKTAQ